MFFFPDNNENSLISPWMKFLQWGNVENNLFAFNGFFKVFEGLIDFVCFVLFGFGNIIGHKDERDIELVESVKCLGCSGYLLM